MGQWLAHNRAGIDATNVRNNAAPTVRTRTTSFGRGRTTADDAADISDALGRSMEELESIFSTWRQEGNMKLTTSSILLPA